MPRLLDTVSRWTVGSLVKASPELRALIEERAREVAKDEVAVSKMQGSPLAWALPASTLPGVRNTKSDVKPATGVKFTVLRELSTYYWCARACINKRQEQIHNLPWDITSVEEEAGDKPNPNDVRAIQEFFKTIAGPNRGFRPFIDMVVDDLLTLDGAAIARGRKGVKLAALVPVDATTIRIRVDRSGLLPQPPDFAYEQWVRGKLVAEMTTEEMDYLMMNARTNTPYGLSPLESLILIVNSALKSEVSNLSILTDGNIPEGIITLPKDWTSDQVKDFQLAWNAMLAGQSSEQQRVKFLPGGDGASYIQTKKPSDMQFSEMEKWLAIKTCAMFGVSPQSIGMTFDINRATAVEQGQLAKNESIRPLANLLEDYFTQIIQTELGFPNLRFVFGGIDTRDASAEAEVNTKYIQSGVLTINQVRQRIGEDPVPEGDKLFILTASGPQLVEDIGEEAEMAEPVEPPQAPEAPKAPEPPKPAETEEPAEKLASPLDELKRWRTVALNDLSKGRPFRKFQSSVIDLPTLAKIDLELQNCTTPVEVRAVFRKFITSEPDRALDAAAALLNELEGIIGDGPRRTEAAGS